MLAVVALLLLINSVVFLIWLSPKSEEISDHHGYPQRQLQQQQQQQQQRQQQQQQRQLARNRASTKTKSRPSRSIYLPEDFDVVPWPSHPLISTVSVGLGLLYRGI